MDVFDFMGKKSSPPAALEASADHSPSQHRTQDCDSHFAYQVTVS